MKNLLHQLHFTIDELVYCDRMEVYNRANYSRLWTLASKHLLGWAMFIAYELIYLYVITGALGNPYPYFLHYTINIILFYFNAHFLLNYAVSRAKGVAVIAPLLVIAEIVAFIGIKYLAVLLIFGEGLDLGDEGVLKKYIVSNGMRLIYIMGFSTAYWFALLTIRRNKKLGELERDRLHATTEKILLQKALLQSRNAYLQAQINPHFLFNTLNFMYNASARVSEKLAETVMNLSDMMRYALTGIDEDDKVPLEKEIEHIHNYIRLNQARFNEKLSIDFIVKGEAENLRIIPLALITLVENVFQYGDLQDPENPALISIEIHEGKLELELKNKKRANQRIRGHGTGIRNLRERLDIYYRSRYSLDIRDEECCYTLILMLTLNE